MASERSQSEGHEVAWFSHKRGEHCDKCGEEIGRGSIIQANRADGLRCATCAGYADLCFLPAGDPKLTRMATNLTSRYVVVVEWKRARKRHERQGILIDEKTYDAVLAQVEAGGTAFKMLDLGGGHKALWKD